MSDVAGNQTRRWIESIPTALERTGVHGAEAARYLREHRIRIRLRKQSAGARWTIDRRIEIHPQYVRDALVSPYALSLVIHEVYHLRQGPLTALSVYGELEAWRVQFRYLRDLEVPPPGSVHQRELIDQLLALPPGWKRLALSTARRLMRGYGGKAYRIDLLPLYPIHYELAYVPHPSGARSVLDY